MPTALKSKDQLEREHYAKVDGNFAYASGVSGSRTVVGKVRAVLAHSAAGGSFTINGGDSIPIPVGVGFAFAVEGDLSDASFVFTGTDMYLVELVQ